jgi:hypothetical protein
VEGGEGRPVVTKSKTEHVVLANNALRCLHCGAVEELAFPMRIQVMTLTSELFTKEHAHCKETPDSPKNRTFTTPHQWRAGHDVGISSSTIAHVFARTGIVGGRADVPYDPDDFGRCYRLLKLFPTWRSRLDEVAARYPAWTALVAAWDELTALFEEESPSGRAPKLYERMRQLRGVA